MYSSKENRITKDCLDILTKIKEENKGSFVFKKEPEVSVPFINISFESEGDYNNALNSVELLQKNSSMYSNGRKYGDDPRDATYSGSTFMPRSEKTFQLRGENWITAYNEMMSPRQAPHHFSNKDKAKDNTLETGRTFD